ncbi:putative serine dehydratase domain-containing protein [Lentinula boryana]|uniref:Serine dehydratase domain-containing protein n=1 Tax=Lentinula boryana TaxID=40481 RepID=A0ABQ8QV72_9AGAR|nr:putative serine dehydratase domain-containing protein [Lentinula boryana]
MHDTETPYHVMTLPSKSILVDHFVGKGLDELRTPALIIDRKVFAANCAAMHSKAKQWGTAFRAHLKTHKTVEGTRLQMISSADRTNAVVVSTMMEAWEVARNGLFKEGTVKDLLYGLPVAPNKVADLSGLWDEVAQDGGIVRVLIDHPDQIKFLEDCESKRQKPRKWSVFVKIDGGQKRAGVSAGTSTFENLVKALLTSPVISIYGFYAHAGNAYASTSLDQASTFLSAEVESVNAGAELTMKIASALGVDLDSRSFVLSVGSTPTAHAASAENKAKLSALLHGSLELHAGNYPMLDLQQEHTNLIDRSKVAQRVLVTVVSCYPGRGLNGTDEVLVDGGAIAFSKDTGPSGSFGEVMGMSWKLGRISQEHGTLIREGPVGNEELKVGDEVEIIGQHACLIAAAYPWYYVVDTDLDGGKKVVDIWVPWKGW